VREIRRILFFESGAAKIQANQRRFDEAVASIEWSISEIDDDSTCTPHAVSVRNSRD
jgi:hypothetical protein